MAVSIGTPTVASELGTPAWTNPSYALALDGNVAVGVDAGVNPWLLLTHLSWDVPIPENAVLLGGFGAAVVALVTRSVDPSGGVYDIGPTVDGDMALGHYNSAGGGSGGAWEESTEEDGIWAPGVTTEVVRDETFGVGIRMDAGEVRINAVTVRVTWALPLSRRRVVWV